MKKTILATMLTSLFAATAAQSATVVDSDGVTVNLTGELEIQFAKDFDTAGPKLDVYDANVGVDVAYALTDSVSAIGVISFDTQNGEDDESNADAELDDAYVGFASDTYGTLTFGKQVTIYDDAGISEDYRLGYSSFYDQDDSGEQVIKYTFERNAVYGGIAYMLNDGDNVNNDAYAVDGKLGVRFSGLDLTVFYGQGEKGETADTVAEIGDKSKSLNLEARYTIADLTLMAAYGMVDRDAGNSTGYTHDDEGYAAGALYTIDKVVLAGGWALLDADNADHEVNSYYANVTYNFNSNVNVYAEVGGDDAEDSEVGYVAGMTVTF
ncbi:porin [Psychromonas aquatilis]|uniref:Porin n=1 Tax=Psychromonas aquatilis TaxID=2005072 RepID=A0ABU9GTA7_9GAMM